MIVFLRLAELRLTIPTLHNRYQGDKTRQQS
jgi:hypothetical protein